MAWLGNQTGIGGQTGRIGHDRPNSRSVHCGGSRAIPVAIRVFGSHIDAHLLIFQDPLLSGSSQSGRGSKRQRPCSVWVRKAAASLSREAFSLDFRINELLGMVESSPLLMEAMHGNMGGAAIEVGIACSGGDGIKPWWYCSQHHSNRRFEFGFSITFAFSCDKARLCRDFIMYTAPCSTAPVFGDVCDFAGGSAWCYRTKQIRNVPRCHILVFGSVCSAFSTMANNRAEHQGCIGDKDSVHASGVSWKGCIEYAAAYKVPMLDSENALGFKGRSSATGRVDLSRVSGMRDVATTLTQHGYGFSAEVQRAWEQGESQTRQRVYMCMYNEAVLRGSAASACTKQQEYSGMLHLLARPASLYVRSKCEARRSMWMTPEKLMESRDPRPCGTSWDWPRDQSVATLQFPACTYMQIMGLGDRQPIQTFYEIVYGEVYTKLGDADVSVYNSDFSLKWTRGNRTNDSGKVMSKSGRRPTVTPKNDMLICMKGIGCDTLRFTSPDEA